MHRQNKPAPVARLKWPEHKPLPANLQAIKDRLTNHVPLAVVKK